LLFHIYTNYVLIVTICHIELHNVLCGLYIFDHDSNEYLIPETNTQSSNINELDLLIIFNYYFKLFFFLLYCTLHYNVHNR